MADGVVLWCDEIEFRPCDLMNISRRSILKQAGLLASAAALPLNQMLAADVAEPLPEVLLPYLQNPGADAMTVCFLAQKATAVKVALVKDGQSKLIEIEGTGTAIPGTPWTLWKTRLTKLLPGTAYKYQVRHTLADKQETTPTYTFRTFNPNAPELKVAIFNDIHNRLETFQAALATVKPDDFEFTIFNGDMINDPSASDGAAVVFRLWNDYVRLIDGSQKPIVFMRGNHELRGSFSKKLSYMFDLPNLVATAPEEDQQWQFAFNAGPVHFVFMDTGEDDSPTTDPTSYKRPRFWEAYRRKQTAWLDKHLTTPAVKDARHRVFVSHIPLHDPTGDYSIVSRDEWSKKVADAKFELMLAGHDHSWKFVPEKKEFKVGKGPETDTPLTPVLIGGGPAMNQGTLILLTADSKGLRTKMYAADGGKLLHSGDYKV